MKNILSALIVLCLSVNLMAQTWYVKFDATGNGQSWANASGDLNAILSQAAAGDEIWVSAGIYYPVNCNPCDSTDRAVRFTIPDGVALYGGFIGNETQRSQRDHQANLTILSGDIDRDGQPANNSYNIIYTSKVSSQTTLDGFTVQDGNADDLDITWGSLGNSGAAWFNEGSLAGNESSPTIRNCIFSNNKAKGFGGAFYSIGDFDGVCSPNFYNCRFTQNYSVQGGGAYFSNATFGGHSESHFENCRFDNNSSFASGAAMYNNAQFGYTRPILTNCIFEQNISGQYGGAMYNLGKGGDAIPQITNCTFIKNEAYAAGAIYNLGSEYGNGSPVITNCTFFKNKAAVGACVYNQASDSTGTCNTVVTNSIFWENIAGYGEVFQSGYASPHISHSLVQVTDCSELNTGTQSAVTCGPGMIYASDPKFVDTTNHNFHLAAGSPVINKGSNQAILDQGVYFDQDSLIRVWQAQVDFGPYEYDAPAYDVPAFTQQPASQETCAGSAIQLSVVTSGTQPQQYQWYRNRQAISGANNPQLSLSAVTVNQSGNYHCRVISLLNDTIFSNTALLTINNTVNPAIQIITQSTEFCAGTEISITASPTHGGTDPTYEWLINGQSQAGANNKIFTISNLQNQDRVTCRMTSSLECVTATIVTSNQLTFTVNEVTNPSISISSDKHNICAGTTINFQTSIQHGGNQPVYRWLVNGQPIGDSGAQLALDNLTEGDQVSCEMTSSKVCAQPSKVTSNSIQISVTSEKTPSISISADQTGICFGTTVTFSADIQFGGANPLVEWTRNGQSLPNTGQTISLSDLQEGDEVQARLNSTEPCRTLDQAASNTIRMEVTDNAEPSLEIAATDRDICEGEPVTFTAMPVYGGNDPQLTWYRNGQQLPQNTIAIILDDLNNGDQISCFLRSDLACVSKDTADSNVIDISVTDRMTASVSLDVDKERICAGDQLTFTTETEHGGTTPVFLWELDGQLIDHHQTTYLTDSVSGEQTVRVALVSSQSCVENDTVWSESISVQADEAQNATILIAASDTIICPEHEISLTASAEFGGDDPDFRWLLNSKLIASGTSVLTLTDYLKDSDTLTCTLISSANCVVDPVIESTPIIFSIDSSACIVSTTAQPLDDHYWILSPNPATDFVQLSLSDVLTKETEIRIFDMSGRLVINRQLLPGTNTAGISLHSIPAGTYHFQLYNAYFISSKLLVKTQ